MVKILSSPRGLPATTSVQSALKKSFYSIPAATTEHLYMVYRGESDGYAIGSAGTILDYTDEKWAVHSNSGLIAKILLGIDASEASDELVIVGQTGTLIRGTVSGGVYTFTLDAQSGVLTTNNLRDARWLYEASGIGGADRIIAVGYDGTILKYDSGSWGATVWTEVTNSITEYLLGIDGNPGTPLVSVGYNGGIYKSDDNGDTWEEWVAAGELTSNYLVDVIVSGSTDIWACGYGGVIVHYDGTSWSVIPTPTTNTLNGIYMFSDDDGYAVGNYGTILHWNGEEWLKAASPTVSGLSYIHGASVNRLSIVGTTGTTLNYFGDVLPTQLVDRAGIVQPRSLTEEAAETQVFTDEEIRDTNAHNSSISNVSRYKIITVYVDNDLNQSISIQVKANRANSTTGATNIGTPFSVAATSGVEARTITPENEGFLPYIFVEATCSVSPASGDLNVYTIGRN